MVDELVAEAKAANEAKAAYDAHMARVRELLPIVRKQRKDLTVVQLETMIDRAYDRGTISRYTAEAAGTTRGTTKPRTQKRAKS